MEELNNFDDKALIEQLKSKSKVMQVKNMEQFFTSVNVALQLTRDAIEMAAADPEEAIGYLF